MESFSCLTARSYLGRNVNLHLKDGAVIVNVQLTKILKKAGKNKNSIEYTHHRIRKAAGVPLSSVAWAEMLNLDLTKSS